MLAVTECDKKIRIVLFADYRQEADMFKAAFRSRQDMLLSSVCSDINRLQDDIATHKPDVLLINRIVMHGNAALEVVRQIRADFPDLYIIGLVGRAPEEAATIADLVSFVLPGPLLFGELLAVIRQQPKRSPV